MSLPQTEENTSKHTVVPSSLHKLPATTWKTFSAGLGITIILGAIATLLAPLPGLAIMGSLTIALLIGLAWRNTIGLSKTYTAGVRFSAQKLLRYGIILTGVRLNFTLLLSSGLQILLLDVLLITFGLTIIPWLAHRLGLSQRLAFLIAVGQSICGASAVGAIAAVLPDTNEDDISLAVAICGLVGTIGVLIYTFSAHVLFLPEHLYGLLTGSTLHEIAQVVAAGPAGGTNAANLAMIVKLTRVMLLAPIAMLVVCILALRTRRTQKLQVNWKKLPIPWFVFGFLAVGMANSLGMFSHIIADIILQASVFFMVIAMAAMGLMVDISTIRKTGLRAFCIALLVFLLFTAMSILIILVG